MRSNRYFSFIILNTLLLGYAVMAAEAIVKTDASKNIKVSQQATAAKKQIKTTQVSIDTLVAEYHEASEEEAYKIMNQIKQRIALMTQQRQIHAIDKVHKAAEKKSIPNVGQKGVKQKQKSPTKERPVTTHTKTKKHVAKVRTKAKKIRKKIKRHHQKKKNSAMEALSATSHVSEHPNPLSAFGGMTGDSGSHGHSGPGGGMGGHGIGGF